MALVLPALFAITAALTPPSARAASRPTPYRLNRRSSFSSFAGVTLALLDPWAQPAHAADAAVAATVTDKIRLEFVQQVSAEESKMLPMTIGLYGKDAPQAVSAFKALCAGKLAAPCPSTLDLSTEIMERTKQSKKAQYRACVGSESIPVDYTYSSVWSVQQGKRIDAGQVQGKFALRIPPEFARTESAAISHDAAGLLSVRRGGGSFDFGITTAPTPEYDADYMVIGRVIDGMETVEALDAVPVVKAADILDVEAASASRAKACAYGSANSYCSQNKPLKKILLVRTAVL